MNRLKTALVAVCVAAALYAPARTPRGATAAAASNVADDQNQLPTLKPSNVLDEVRRRKSVEPRLSASALARYANALLARKGFDYDFNVCEILPPTAARVRGGTEATLALDYPMTRLDGRGVIFHLVTDDQGGMCGECFLPVPALRVTAGEMTVVADGVTYTLKRPAAFALDEAQLVGSDLKTVLRTWQIPFQTIPVGVSPDGRSLYLDFYEDTGLDELVLEVSDEGRPRFRVRREVVSAEGESVEEHPTDPLNAYLSFLRFRSGGRTHVVRFSGPCT